MEGARLQLVGEVSEDGHLPVYDEHAVASFAYVGVPLEGPAVLLRRLLDLAEELAAFHRTIVGQ